MKKITQHLFFQRNDLRIKDTPFGNMFYLDGCRLKGMPGAPALPIRDVRVALPPGTKPISLQVEIVKTVMITQSKTLVACIQPPVDPVLHNRDPDNLKPTRRFFPRKELYQNAMNVKSGIAALGMSLQIGNIPIATLEISPIQYRKDATVELIEHLVVHISLEKDENLFIKPQISKNQRYKEHSIVHELVVNSDLVLKTPMHLKKKPKLEAVVPNLVPSPKRFMSMGGAQITVPNQVDYLIITDNEKWNSVTMATTGPAGDLVTEFQRLADHKKQRGYRTHIAQIKDIVSGNYGNFSSGVRDLQEIIRNFLKQFIAQKGVEWLLLGGDVSIIPPRLACASAWGRIALGSLDELYKSEWKGTYLGMHVDSNILGKTTHVLTNYYTGERIPYDVSGSSNSTNPGWHYTTNNTFNTRSVNRTNWIKVNGPEALLKNELVWYTPDNMIPTDMYYSSLYGAHYNTPGRHDWDLLNNGLYAQHNHKAIDLDGVDFTVDVGVGRAPVESEEEARIFVDKVITYDNWGVEHPSPSYNRFKKMLLVAEHWAKYFHTITPQAGNNIPPSNYRFSSVPASGYALIHDPALIRENAGNKIVCNYSDTSRKELVFNIDADNNNPGWYYARSQNDIDPSYFNFNFFGVTFRIPVPTEWVVVYGPTADITPLSYDIDKEETDSSVLQQEELRNWMNSNFNRINQVERLYSDVTDMPAGSLSGASLKKLTSDNLETALEGGPHFVSLTGHGHHTGVAHLNAPLISRLTNGQKTFIAIADSCLTNNYEENDAIGELLVKHPGGGAVAYIGNSRYSWIGLGDDFRLEFFNAMKYRRNLATLNDSRCVFRNDTNYWQYKLWTILEQTLMGDPEMNVYRTDQDAYPKFIGNHNTMELHKSTCQWVKKMASWNIRYYDSIEEGISLGYDGCAFCLKEYDHG